MTELISHPKNVFAVKVQKSTECVSRHMAMKLSSVLFCSDPGIDPKLPYPFPQGLVSEGLTPIIQKERRSWLTGLPGLKVALKDRPQARADLYRPRPRPLNRTGNVRPAISPQGEKPSEGQCSLLRVQLSNDLANRRHLCRPR